MHTHQAYELELEAKQTSCPVLLDDKWRFRASDIRDNGTLRRRTIAPGGESGSDWLQEKDEFAFGHREQPQRLLAFTPAHRPHKCV